MAMGRHPRRTVLVEMGSLRPFSDVGGRHVLRLNNSPARRQELAERLRTAGCAVELSGTDWHTTGSFEVEKSVIDQPKQPPGSVWEKEKAEATVQKSENLVALEARYHAAEAKLAELQKEEVFRHKTGVVFKRSRETRNEWRPFCPLCGGPVHDVDLGLPNARACCHDDRHCGRCFDLPPAKSLAMLASEL